MLALKERKMKFFIFSIQNLSKNYRVFINTDTEGKQRRARVRNIFKNSGWGSLWYVPPKTNTVFSTSPQSFAKQKNANFVSNHGQNNEHFTIKAS